MQEEKARQEQLDKEKTKQQEEDKKKKEKHIKQRLVFTEDELGYMQKFSPLFGHSPRAINRYVNIYRIIKAHKSLKVYGDFSRDEYIPILFILAIVVGYSIFAQEFIDKVSAADNLESLSQFLNSVDLNERLEDAVRKHVDDEILGMPMENFKRNVELISRFSFRTLLKQVEDV